MIGMMYLVLMALLALNVSKEVLDAFSVLDTGLVSTLKTLVEANDKYIADFAAQYELNPTKVGPWQNKALVVQEKAKEIVNFIQDKKIEMVIEAEGEDPEAIEGREIDVEKIDAKDNTEIPGYIMIGDNNDRAGRELREKIEAFRSFLIDSIVKSPNADAIRKSIESSLNTEPKKEDELSKLEGNTWETDHFLDSPLAGVLTILSGIQINVKNAESEALKYLYNQIDAGSFKFNQLKATVIPNSNYIIKGNPYQAEVFIAASDTTALPVIHVTENSNPYDSVLADDGETWEYTRREGLEYKTIPVEKGSGKGIYTMSGTSTGTKYWGGIIEMTGPSGTIVKPFKREYLVAEGSITVAPTKMNVFFLGVDNPVDVSVAGVQPDKVDISVTNARHVKRRDGYIIRPIRPGNAYVVVYATIDGKRREMGRREFRVKTVPSPVAMVNSQKGGRIAKSVLLAQLGVFAEMENFDFDLKFTITEFTVSATVQGFTREFTSKSNRFTQEQKNLIGNLNRGQNVYIQDIKAVGPDGATRPLSTINFKLN
jgi:gliding motility-associated protein GldM